MGSCQSAESGGPSEAGHGYYPKSSLQHVSNSSSEILPSKLPSTPRKTHTSQDVPKRDSACKSALLRNDSLDDDSLDSDNSQQTSLTEDESERTAASRQSLPKISHPCHVTNHGNTHEPSVLASSMGDHQAAEKKLKEEADRCLKTLERQYGSSSQLSKADAVVIMEGWNKVLAFPTMFSEALFNRWRLLCALDALEGVSDEVNASDDLLIKATDLLEFSTDPLTVLLGTRVSHGQKLLMGLLDASVRSLCPHSQIVQREAYRPINDDLQYHDTQSNSPMMSRLGLIHGTAEEYLRTFDRCGIQPSQWVHFCEAFLWAMQTHSPYSNDVDEEDLLKLKPECAYSIFVSAHIAKAAIQASVEFRKKLNEPLFTVCVPRFWTRISSSSASKAMLCESFYRELLTNRPELMDFFVDTDMDSMALHLITALDLIVASINKIGLGTSSFRDVMTHLGEMQRRMKIPTASFPIIGGLLIQTLQPLFEQEEQLCLGEDFDCSADELGCAFADLYTEIMAMVSHPMQCEEKLCLEAEEFFKAVASELQWNDSRLENRLWEVNMEIAATGTYVHTSEELEIGARLAWRNSAKCIGRIAWNTLVVRDCRHISRPEAIFKEVEEHLRVATCGTNIQSVMTVFRPRAPRETWGLRFWSSQFVRYAGYKLPDGESHAEANRDGILGDPANLEFTEYLVKQGLWTPPETKSAFDVLPIVLKIPGTHRPYVYQLPEQWVQEVKIEHPKCAAIKELNLRWTAVPAISNFAMNLGGVMYNCCPFNGWFVSIEIVRNLMERYHVEERWAKAMQLDPQERMLEMRVQHEVQVAVLHSFAKAGFSMVDPCAVGKSFLVHTKREREQGRECPAQWSWIGGLVGPTNATWHHEMRDFFVAPQYEYSSEPWMVCNLARGKSSPLNLESSETYSCTSDAGEDFEIPRVLIVFGSQTGTAEAAAHKLSRTLRLLKPTVLSLNDVSGLAIVKEENFTHVLSICSTFNRGEFPSNADVFATTPIKAHALGGSKFAVCAVGSSAYPDFCAAGIRLQALLEKAGGTSLMPLKKVDDAHGSTAPIAAWIHLVERLILPEHVAKVLASRNPAAMTPPVHRISWLKSNERIASLDGDGCDVVANEELLFGGDISFRSTRKVTFKLPDGVTYLAGDHLAVSPMNSFDNVIRFVTCFEEELVGAAEDSGKRIEAIYRQLQQPMIIETTEGGATFPAVLSFQTPATLASALQTSVDFSINESTLDSYVSLIMASLKKVPEGDLSHHLSVQRETLAKLCDTVTSSNASTRDEGTALFLARYPSIIHFLESFKALLCVGGVVKGQGPLIRLADVLVLLPKLRERYYSISSSPCDDPSLVSISVGVVHTKTSEGVSIDGVCSNYLARLRPTVDKAKISIRQSTFRGPKTVESSVIMIGPGTGLAPLIGFLRERELSISNETTTGHPANMGVCYLFGGCRTLEDRIYGAEVDNWETNGVLEHHLALSRQPGEERTYVQDLLLKNGEEICRVLLQDDSHYYICGNAKVADACYEACVRILRQYGKMSRVGAVQHLRKMRANNRWQYDLWGVFSGFQQTTLDPRSKQIFAAKKWLLSFSEG